MVTGLNQFLCVCTSNWGWSYNTPTAADRDCISSKHIFRWGPVWHCTCSYKHLSELCIYHVAGSQYHVLVLEWGVKPSDALGDLSGNLVCE